MLIPDKTACREPGPSNWLLASRPLIRFNDCVEYFIEVWKVENILKFKTLTHSYVLKLEYSVCSNMNRL
jgi:hypothetical protein